MLMNAMNTTAAVLMNKDDTNNSMILSTTVVHQENKKIKSGCSCTPYDDTNDNDDDDEGRKFILTNKNNSSISNSNNSNKNQTTMDKNCLAWRSPFMEVRKDVVVKADSGCTNVNNDDDDHHHHNNNNHDDLVLVNHDNNVLEQQQPNILPLRSHEMPLSTNPVLVIPPPTTATKTTTTAQVAVAVAAASSAVVAVAAASSAVVVELETAKMDKNFVEFLTVTVPYTGWYGLCVGSSSNTSSCSAPCGTTNGKHCTTDAQEQQQQKEQEQQIQNNMILRCSWCNIHERTSSPTTCATTVVAVTGGGGGNNGSDHDNKNDDDDDNNQPNKFKVQNSTPCCCYNNDRSTCCCYSCSYVDLPVSIITVPNGDPLNPALPKRTKRPNKSDTFVSVVPTTTLTSGKKDQEPTCIGPKPQYHQPTQSLSLSSYQKNDRIINPSSLCCTLLPDDIQIGKLIYFTKNTKVQMLLLETTTTTTTTTIATTTTEFDSTSMYHWQLIYNHHFHHHHHDAHSNGSSSMENQYQQENPPPPPPPPRPTLLPQQVCTCTQYDDDSLLPVITTTTEINNKTSGDNGTTTSSSTTIPTNQVSGTIRFCTNKKSYICTHCVRTFPSIRSVQCHIQSTHQQNKKKDHPIDLNHDNTGKHLADNNYQSTDAIKLDETNPVHVTTTTTTSVLNNGHGCHDENIWETPLQVIYQDSYFAIINKPQGMAVMGSKPSLIRSNLLLALKDNNNNNGSIDDSKKRKEIHSAADSTSSNPDDKEQNHKMDTENPSMDLLQTLTDNNGNDESKKIKEILPADPTSSNPDNKERNHKMDTDNPSTENQLPDSSLDCVVFTKPKPVHRLDSLTGGLLVVAKTRYADRMLRQAFMERTVHKKYTAIVVGKMTLLPKKSSCFATTSSTTTTNSMNTTKQNNINTTKINSSSHPTPTPDTISTTQLVTQTPLKRNREAESTTTTIASASKITEWESYVQSLQSNSNIGYINQNIDGKQSETYYEIKRIIPSIHTPDDYMTIVDLWPITGRKHQLRKHLKYLGHPIVGDDRYHGGEKTMRQQRQQQQKQLRHNDKNDDDDDVVVVVRNTDNQEMENQRIIVPSHEGQLSPADDSCMKDPFTSATEEHNNTYRDYESFRNLCLWAVEITLPHPITKTCHTYTLFENPIWFNKVIQLETSKWEEVMNKTKNVK